MKTYSVEYYEPHEVIEIEAECEEEALVLADGIRLENDNCPFGGEIVRT